MRWWSTAAQWRNWPLQVKLGVVLVVPVLGALVLGVLRVQGDVRLAGSYADIERIAAVRVQVVDALTAIQNERNAAVRHGRDLAKLGDVSDAALTRTDAAVGRAPDLGENAIRRFRNLTGARTLLPYARGRVAAGADGGIILIAYDAVTNAVLEFDRALVGRFPDENLTSASIALNVLQTAREQIGIQQAAGLVGVRKGRLTDSDRATIGEADVRLGDSLSDFRAVANPDLLTRYETTVTGNEVARRKLLVLAARTPGVTRPPFTQKQWDTSFNASMALMADVTEHAADGLRGDSSALADSFGNRAGGASVLLLTMVLLAAGIGGVLSRYLLRSVGLLRRTALDVANNRLPAAVASIRAGEAAKVAIDPVPLRTTEEFGQLARAFDAVHAQAVRSAAEEASLRSNLANIFMNLSRRSQGLVERQLRLMEQLEQKEDNPDQLANLFRIDHLATRMRRNNENLMVLSGSGLARRSTEPMAVPDVLRAAVSEVEHYQRAVVRSAPGARIVGYAAGDLVRSISELIENATRFSPPDSQVVISSRLDDDGAVLIDILDEGVGMGGDELREANQRVAAGGGVDVPVSRQMGLFVVGRLTVRHGIRVRLARREDGDGLRASVFVPANVVMAGAEPAPAAPVPLPAPAAPAEPIEVAGVALRLESAGIHVTLSDFPPATTPASILFTAQVPAAPMPDEGPFSWLSRQSAADETPGYVPSTPPVAPEAGPNGLPKRVPKGQLLAPPMNEQRPRPRTRDADRTRGFLSGFQAGVRASENRKGASDT